jgi:DNA excision repair protein ERCC-2
MASPMFCPDCKALLTRKKRGSRIVQMCKQCGYVSSGGEQPPPALRKVVHQDFPLFPYEQIRGGQREFMVDMKTAAGDGKILLAQAPTGIGKTAASLSVLLEYTMANGKKLMFLTAKQSQHTIVVNTLREMPSPSGKPIRAVDIIAKQAMCPEDTQGLPGYAFAMFCKTATKYKTCRMNASDNSKARDFILSRIMHVGELRRVCERLGSCPYKTAMDAIPDVDVIVCDYNYIFDVMQKNLLEKLDGGLGDLVLVIDEAHNLPDRIRSNLSFEMTSFKMKEAALETGKYEHRGQRYTAGLRRALDAWAKELQVGSEEYVDREKLTNELDRLLAEVLGEKYTPSEYVEWLGEIGQKALERGADSSYALELAEFLSGWTSAGEASARILSSYKEDAWRLKLCHLDPSVMGGPIFSEVHGAVLMSGTLCPPEMYADVLGVPAERRMFHVYDSPFPPENRKVVALKGVSSEYTKRGEAMYARYAYALAELARATPGNVAAFFPSYEFVREVSNRLAGNSKVQNVIVENRGMAKTDREAILDRLRARREPNLLIAVQGGSLGEGIDYERNLLSVLVVAGVPLPPPNKEVLALKNHCIKCFGQEKGEIYGYYALAFNKVVQSAGRLIRSEKDRGVVVLMDERFMQSRYAVFLPPELMPKVLGHPAELVEEVKGFFGR